MEAHELFKELNDGYGLRKKHTHSHSEEIIGVEFFYFDREHRCFYRKGWGSAIGRNVDRLEEILKHPEKWEIAGRIEERQWITEDK